MEVKEEHFCKCTRCKNIHKNSERIEKANPKSAFNDVVCPRCGATIAYDMSVLKIYKETDKGFKAVEVDVIDIFKSKANTYFIFFNSGLYRVAELKSGIVAVMHNSDKEELKKRAI